MRCMKMPRSHSENENVQFVQELAEVDGPFESPININFRDLTKLELPSLVWNRSDACPKKMKVTNTGHTVIVSGKWKCERPYLTGGPLLGKYVFSQIHFHWGQDDCKGSEHLVCGEGFPLEMHVAHFKADYISQECALKEKDGMVVLVYLFKIQDEPNISLKKILNCLTSIKQANSSQPLDPRPILSLCNPFTDDYFMYWGSVVTSTCAHILMWLVCREPFGISKDQVSEFRKILDSAQQPICRNNRETQPLHKRNVFHVNASKNLDSPLLPVKKIVGCFCGKGSEDNESVNSSKDCCCRGSVKDQEDVQGSYAESNVGSLHMFNEGGEPTCRRMGSQPQNYNVHRSLVVQRATVQSAPLLPKLFENTYIGQLWPTGTIKESNTNAIANSNFSADSKVKLVSHSCCFFPIKEVGKAKNRSEKRRSRPKSFNSIRALSHIMNSLEALKNQTCKKLKEIDSINQQIKGMKSFCHEPEDRKWLKRIEKIMSRQKRFTKKSSQGCLVELKKLAKDCNIEQLFENKFSSHSESTKMTLMNKSTTDRILNRSNVSSSETTRKIQSKPFTIDKALKFSSKAQKLIQSFFVDIRDSEDLQQNSKKDLTLKKKKSISPSKSKRSKESYSTIVSARKGYITKKMFNLGNLGDRFFIEVKSEDTMIPEETGWGKPDPHADRLFVSVNESQTENPNITESDLMTKIATEETSFSTTKQLPEDIIPLHRADVAVGFGSETQRSQPVTNLMKRKKEFEPNDDVHEASVVDTFSECESETSTVSSYKNDKSKGKSYARKRATESTSKDQGHPPIEYSFDQINPERMLTALRDLTSSTDSTATQRMIIAKFHKRQSREEIWDQKSSVVAKISSKGQFYGKNVKKQKTKNFNFEGYYIKKKSKKQKIQTERSGKTLDSSEELSSVSKEDLQSPSNKGKWKTLTKARFKLKIEKTSDSTIDSTIGYSILSPPQGKIHLSSKTTKEGERAIDAIIVEELQSSARRENKIQAREVVLSKKEEQFLKKISDSSSKPLRRPLSVTSSKKSVKISSIDSRNNSPEKPLVLHMGTQNEIDVSSVKKTMKNKSVMSLSGRFKKHSSDTGKRFVQAKEDRHRIECGTSDSKKQLEYNKVTATDETLQDLNQEIRLDVHRKQISEEKMQGENVTDSVDHQSHRKPEFEVGFFTTLRQKRNEKLLSETYLKDETGKMPKSLGLRCDIEKYHFLDKELQEIKISPQKNFITQQESKESRENLVKSDSNKSLASNGPGMKGDANAPTADSKDLPAAISYTTIKKSSQSRPHSVESLTSLTKTCKRKRKKRPHCSKRISKHYMRKNSCVFRKPNKFDSKPLNFMNLTDEQQLKIISVNVAKYLKQKFVEKKRSLNLKNSEETNEIQQELEKQYNVQREQELELKNELLESGKRTEFQHIKHQSPCGPKNDIEEQKLELKIKHDLLEEIELQEIQQQDGQKNMNNLKQQSEHSLEEQCLMDQQLEDIHGKQNEPKNVENSDGKGTEKPTRDIMETKLPLPIKKVFDIEKLDEGSPLKVEVAEIKANKGSIKDSKIKKPNSPRPPLNFIKLNKLMAGRYKRQNSIELKPDSSETQKKGDEPKTPEAPTPTLTPPPTSAPPTPPKKTPPIKGTDQKRPGSSKSGLPVRAPDKKVNTKPPKGNQSKSLDLKKTSEDVEKKNLKKKPPSPMKKPEESKTAEEQVPADKFIAEGKAVGNMESLAAVDKSLPLEKTSSTLVPTYMMTSFVTPTIDLSEKSQKLNPFLMSVKKKNMNTYLPEIFYDAQNYYDAKSTKKDTIYAKDLENLIKLQMCLNNEIATNIENSMNYIKTLLSQDYSGTAIVEKAPVASGLGTYDASQNGIVLIEMNDILDCSTSASDFGEEAQRLTSQRDENFKSRSDSKTKEIPNPNGSIPKEYGDSRIINSACVPNVTDAEEEYYSDSSYNCEISITLNGNAEETPEVQSNHEAGNVSQEYPATRSAHLLRRDSNSSQMTTQLEGGNSSQSIVLKPLRKKRKDNEISMEMKKKLLEILEGEIRREMSLNYQASSENSSDALTLRWDESTGTNRSQSFTESSSDNTEVLAQISETMRQYLSEYKKRRLVKKNLGALDKNKSEDDS